MHSPRESSKEIHSHGDGFMQIHSHVPLWTCRWSHRHTQRNGGGGTDGRTLRPARVNIEARRHSDGHSDIHTDIMSTQTYRLAATHADEPLQAANMRTKHFHIERDAEICTWEYRCSSTDLRM